MRKYVLSMMLVILSQMGMAQIVLDNEAAVVYYMPKNELCITLVYDVVKQEPGVFYQYAKRYLGTKDVITEEKTTYVLRHMSTDLLSYADMDRAYKILVVPGSKEQLVTLTADGRLAGYNIGKVTTEEAEEFGSPACEHTPPTALMPLLEEHFMASSTAKMAEGAAKQIYRIREARLNILAGEVEHVPADGKAMELVLAELDEQERVLTELFVGKTSVMEQSESLRYVPTESVEQDVLCRFSAHTGVVAKDDLSGEPVYMSVKAHKQVLGTNTVVDKKAPALSQIYYNLPGKAEIALAYKGKEMANGVYQIAQFGTAIPLAKQLFYAGKPGTIVRFDPTTGNILSIEQ